MLVTLTNFCNENWSKWRKLVKVTLLWYEFPKTLLILWLLIMVWFEIIIVSMIYNVNLLSFSLFMIFVWVASHWKFSWTEEKKKIMVWKLPFRKHGRFAFILSVNLHFCLTVKFLIFFLALRLNNSYCENIAVRFHKMHYSKIPDI